MRRKTNQYINKQIKYMCVHSESNLYKGYHSTPQHITYAQGPANFSKVHSLHFSFIRGLCSLFRLIYHCYSHPDRKKHRHRRNEKDETKEESAKLFAPPHCPQAQI